MDISILFYVPNYQNVPQELLLGTTTIFNNLKPYGVSDGENAWLLITYWQLRAQGIECQLTDSLSESGIIFGTFESFPYHHKASRNSLLVYVKGDKPIHPYANLNIVESSYQKSTVEKSHFIPLWPQPGLKKRDKSRGDLFKRVAYFGEFGNLAKELKEELWEQKLDEMALQWIIKRHQDWADYTDVDVVIAVRDFSRRLPGKYTKDQGAWKPATKLYNAWIAGVPAILGEEPAFRELRKSHLDYIEVKSVEAALQALKELQRNPKLRQEMIENGWHRAEDFKPEAITSKWIDFINEIAIPQFKAWNNLSDFSRKIFFVRRYSLMKLYHYKKKLLRSYSQF